MPEEPVHRETNGGLDSTEIADGDMPYGGLRTRLGRFYRHGEPVYLVQAGTYGMRTDRGYDGREPDFWLGLVDKLASLQSDGVRFRLRIDPWAFCYDAQALSPWHRTDAGWDLTRFDKRFWTVLRGASEHALSLDVLLEMVVFNAATLRLGRGGTGWPRNPLNAALGGPLARDPAATFFSLPRLDRFDLETAVSDAPAIRMQAAQERFVREAVRRLDGLDNVTWEIASQLEGVDPVRISFVGHYVELLHRVDALDRLATASVRSLRRSDQDLYRQVGVDTVQFWLPYGLEPHEELTETVTALRDYGKPVVVGESEIGAAFSTLARSAVWQTYVAGGHACVEGMVDDPALGAFVRFVADTAPGALEPDPRIVTSRTEGLHCHGGRAESGSIVLYATTESPASEVEATLRLEPGTWQAVSILPATGEVLEARTIEAIRGATQLPLPSFEEDLAVRVTRLD